MSSPSLIQRIVRHADAQGAPETPTATGIPGFTYVRARRPTSIQPSLYRPLFCVVLQGRKESGEGEQRVSFGAGDSLIVSLDLPTVSRVTEASEEKPYVGLALEVDFREVRALADDIGECEAPSSPCQGALATGCADAALFDAMGRLFGLVERPADRSVLLPLVTREIHYRMLQAGHGTMLRSLTERSSHASRIARAIARIRQDFPAAVSVEDLARAAGMSPSTFHEHFKAATNTTPLQFQKDLRLLEARQLLQGGGSTVSAVAYDVGYESPNQFSREYARKFGNPPRVDLAAV